MTFDVNGHQVRVSPIDLPCLSWIPWYVCEHGINIKKASLILRAFLGHDKTTPIGRIITNAPDGMWVDHIDGDTLNNTRGNLRLVTPKQNQHNRQKVVTAKSLSKYKGSSFSQGRWRAACNRRHLGTFNSEIEAAKAYDIAAAKAYGRYARLNSPDNHPECTPIPMKFPDHSLVPAALERLFPLKFKQLDTCGLPMRIVAGGPQDDERRPFIAKALRALTQRQRYIVIRRFFFDETLQEIGRFLKLTHERVRQIEAMALRHLRFYFLPERAPSIKPHRPPEIKGIRRKARPFLGSLDRPIVLA